MGTDHCIDIDECARYNETTDHECSYEPEGICTNTIGSYECSCPQGMGGNGTLDDPCYETIVCLDNEEIDACANLNCYKTCDSYLNYLADVCPVGNSTRIKANRLLLLEQEANVD